MGPYKGANLLRWPADCLNYIGQWHKSQNTIPSLPRLSRRIWLAITFTVVFILMLSWSASEQHATVKSLSGIKTYFTGDDKQVVELQGITIGKAFPVDSGERPLDHLIPELRDRFEVTANARGFRAAYPQCSINLSRYEGTILQKPAKFWKPRGVVAIAINVRKEILPAQAVAVLEAAAHLLAAKNKVYISIYENGSDDGTGAVLTDFVAAAQTLGVTGIWATSSRMQNGAGQDRTVMLSEIRNHAIAPLMPHISGILKRPSTLLFMDDVLTCASDILELVHQQRLQHADMVMGADYGDQNDQARLYDLWVARGINGALAYLFTENFGLTAVTPNDDWVRDLLSTQNRDIYQRWLDGRPLPVYCMWGGMAAFDSALFAKQHLRFRSSITSGWTGGSANGALGDWGKLVSDAYLQGDCPGASECEYICCDVWNLRHGKARVLFAPQARAMYSMAEWNKLIDTVPRTRWTGPDTDGGDMVNWDTVTMPKTVECIPSRSKAGELLDCWKQQRYRFDPYWEWTSKVVPRRFRRSIGLT